MLFVGDDWAEAHHDIEIVDETGRRLAGRRLPEGLAGISRLHELVADHLDRDAEPDQVLVGIETDRGPWVQALIAAGYTVYAINPFQASRTAIGTPRRGRSPMRAMRMCSPSSSAWTGTITARSPGTAMSPSM